MRIPEGRLEPGSEDAHNLIDPFVHDEKLNRAYEQACEDVGSILQRLGEVEPTHAAYERLHYIVGSVNPEWMPEAAPGAALQQQAQEAKESYIEARDQLAQLNQRIEELLPDITRSGMEIAGYSAIIGALGGIAALVGETASVAQAGGVVLSSAAGGAVVGAAMRSGADGGSIISDIRRLNDAIDQAVEDAHLLHRIREDFDIYWNAKVDEGAEPQAQ